MIRRRRCGAMRGRTRRRPSWPSVKQPAALGCLCDSLSASFSWRGNVACAFAADWINASNGLVRSPHSVLHGPVSSLSLSFHQRGPHVKKTSSSSCGTGSWLFIPLTHSRTTRKRRLDLLKQDWGDLDTEAFGCVVCRLPHWVHAVEMQFEDDQVMALAAAPQKRRPEQIILSLVSQELQIRPPLGAMRESASLMS